MKKVVAVIILLMFAVTSVAHSEHNHTGEKNTSDAVQQSESPEKAAISKLGSETPISSSFVIFEIVSVTILTYLAFRHYYRKGKE